MDAEQFRKAAAVMAKFIVYFKENLGKQNVTPNVKPGFLANQLPKAPPAKPESFKEIMKDLNEKIVPGLTHWHHPQFFAYFPSSGNYPGVLGEMITGALGINSTSWTACPAATELEMQMTDWIARAIALPKHFIFSEPNSTGGGVLTTSASESILCAILAARAQALRFLKEKENTPEIHDSVLLPRLVLYCSAEAHSCVEKAAMISLVQLRILDVDESFALRGDVVQEAIENDLAEGLHPFFVICTLGTTGTTAVDNIKEIAPIVRSLPSCWLHVDGAYGGSSFICPELRGQMDGLELADSFNINPNKWMLVNAESSVLYVKDKSFLETALVDDSSLYETSDLMKPHEYRHWGIPMGRRFRALKVWMTLQNYGVEGIQRVIRNHCALAKLLERYIRADSRFQIVNKVKMGLVCFRLIGEDQLTETLLVELNKQGKIHLTPSKGRDMYFIRFAICYEHASKEHIDFAWAMIKGEASKIVPEMMEQRTNILPVVFPAQNNEEDMQQRRGALTDFGNSLEMIRGHSSKTENSSS